MRGPNQLRLAAWQDGATRAKFSRSWSNIERAVSRRSSTAARAASCSVRSGDTCDAGRTAASRRLSEVKVAETGEPGTGFVLILSNGRRIASGWGFGDAELARL